MAASLNIVAMGMKNSTHKPLGDIADLNHNRLKNKVNMSVCGLSEFEDRLIEID
jgi:hypothetical protein